MKLNVLERLTLLQVLPQEGDFVTLKITRDLQNSLSLTEEEFKLYDVKRDDEQIIWNDNGKEEKEILIGEKATDIIVETLSNLDKNKKLTAGTYGLYNKFINNN